MISALAPLLRGEGSREAAGVKAPEVPEAFPLTRLAPLATLAPQERGEGETHPFAGAWGSPRSVSLRELPARLLTALDGRGYTFT